MGKEGMGPRDIDHECEPEAQVIAVQGILRIGHIDVVYRPHLKGGGETFGQDFVRLVAEYHHPVDRLLEWCSGPGFIGFALLAHGLCRELDLLDINPEAIAVCNETIQRNRLANVRASVSDCFDSAPQAVWDLIVANPPHSGTDEDCGASKLIYQDPGWRIHRKFYHQVRPFVAPGGLIIMQENASLSESSDFVGMIDDSGLRVVDNLFAPTDDPMYYLISAPAL
jgi:hypothetical protein